jgi:hypothetical protein
VVFDIELGYIQVVSLVRNVWTNLGGSVMEGVIFFFSAYSFKNKFEIVMIEHQDKTIEK